MNCELFQNLVSIPPVYGSYLEVSNQKQLDEFSGDPDALRMQVCTFVVDFGEK